MEPITALLCRLLRVPELLIAFVPVGDIPEECAEEKPALEPHGRADCDLEGKLAPGSMEAAELEQPIGDPRLAGRLKTFHAGKVRGTQPRRDDRIHEPSADGLRARPTERRCRLGIPG